MIPQLLAAGYRVRALGRSLKKLQCLPWAGHPHVELARGDVLELTSLEAAARGCWAAFYLVHSMVAAPGKYAEADRLGAQNMARAAAAAGLNRIIYLGGLGNPEDPNLSKHLRSRTEVARILQSGPTPTTFLRAAMILGAGSASFEILRYLVDRLPVMITPTWVRNPVQPIAISNVLNYLQGCLEHDEVLGQTFDIGGPDILNYQELFRIYAEAAGLSRRLIIPVPVLTPTLSALWIHLVTPVPAAIARPLAAGLRNPVVCEENRIREIIPQKLLTCRETIRLALEKMKMQQVETCWTDAGGPLPPEWVYCGDTAYAGGTILASGFRVELQASPAQVWDQLIRIGGKNGYFFADALWRLRGGLDRLLGGMRFSGRPPAPERAAGGGGPGFLAGAGAGAREALAAPGGNAGAGRRRAGVYHHSPGAGPGGDPGIVPLPAPGAGRPPLLVQRLSPAQLHLRRPAERSRPKNRPPHPLRPRTLHPQTAPGVPPAGGQK